MRIADFLEDSGRIVAYYPGLVRLTKSVTANVLLCQFVYWCGKGWDPNGWLYKTQSEITNETGLTRTEQSTARNRLRDLGVLEEEKRGVPARLFYRVNLKKLLKLWAEIHPQSQSCQDAGFLQTECANPANNIQRLPSGNLNAQLARAQSPGDNAAPLQTHGEAAKSTLLQGVHAATVVAYPDKSLTQPVLNPDKSNYVQPAFTVFEFENSFFPEEGVVPLWEEEGFDHIPSVGQMVGAIALPDQNHIGDANKMVDQIAPPEPPTIEEKQPHPELQDRIQDKKRVPPPRPRKMSRDAQNYAYRYDASGWLQLPAANGQNSQARAIAVRAMQELIVVDYGGSSGLQVEWEQDDDGFWSVIDHKCYGEDLTMDEVFSKRGRLPIQALRNYAVTFANLDQDTFNDDLQRLYETALEYRKQHGRLARLEEGERWIDQPIFDEYLGEWLKSA